MSCSQSKPAQKEPSLECKKPFVATTNVEETDDEKDRIWVEKTLDRLLAKYKRDKDGLYIIMNHLVVTDDDADINFDKLFQHVKGIERGAILDKCKKLTSLGKVEFVKGYLILRGTPIKDIGNLKLVDWYVDIRGTSLTKEDFANVQVKSDIMTD